MKKFLVHSLTPPRTENKSARRMKQATLVIALLLPATAAGAQRFPDANELLANVRLHQSQQESDLHGQLRQEARVVPFHLVQNGPVVRYICSNPDETLQLRSGASDSRLGDRKGNC